MAKYYGFDPILYESLNWSIIPAEISLMQLDISSRSYKGASVSLQMCVPTDAIDVVTIAHTLSTTCIFCSCIAL